MSNNNGLIRVWNLNNFINFRSQYTSQKNFWRSLKFWKRCRSNRSATMSPYQKFLRRTLTSKILKKFMVVDGSKIYCEFFQNFRWSRIVPGANSDYGIKFSDPKNISIYGFYVISILFIFLVNLCNSNWCIADSIDRKKSIECWKKKTWKKVLFSFIARTVSKLQTYT